MKQYVGQPVPFMLLLYYVFLELEILAERITVINPKEKFLQYPLVINYF